MNKFLLSYLCDPKTQEDLDLIIEKEDSLGRVQEGWLVSTPTGNRYPIRNGVPRFSKDFFIETSVESFGDQWNFFNYQEFKKNWLNETIKNTFGDSLELKDKWIVDAGAGSGMQSLWFLELGAQHVISLDLSAAVDGVIKKNLTDSGYKNWDIIQCSIDEPPIKRNALKGVVICHNVIQHTPSVEKTAHALFKIVSKGSEFIFNCYDINNQGFFRSIRWKWHLMLRGFLSKRSFKFRLAYSKLMAFLQFVPGLGWFLGKTLTLATTTGHGIPFDKNYFTFRYRACLVNTFDAYGAHAFQHYKSDEEIKSLLSEIQPNKEKILNFDKYFSKPKPIGCALRVVKG